MRRVTSVRGGWTAHRCVTVNEKVFLMTAAQTVMLAVLLLERESARVSGRDAHACGALTRAALVPSASGLGLQQ